MAETEKPLRNYLVHIELGLATIERIAEAGSAVRRALQSVSKGDLIPAYRSMGHDQFGYFVRTRLAANQVLAAMNTPKDRETVSAFRRDDKVLVVDVGNDAVSIDKNEPMRWLQHR